MSLLAGERGSATPTNIMTKQNVNTSEAGAGQAASKKHQTIKLGLDVHADSVVVVRILDHSAPQPAQKFTPDKFCEWVATQLGQCESVHSCYEAGPFGYGLHRHLLELGVKNIVVQAVCLDERRKGVNHDKSDARELAMRLDRYVAGNTHAVAIVRVPSPEEEQRRAASRQREQLKRQVTRMSAQGRSLLLTQGLRMKKNWWHEKVWQKHKAMLPEWLVRLLEAQRRLLASVTAELAAATGVLEQAAPTCRPKGLGGLTSEVVEREVCDWDRFKNRRQVGSYTGLCGGISSSGKTQMLLPITKHGNARLRTALIELAWRLVVWQRDCKLIRKWAPALCNPKAGRGAKKKAIVAVARQMAVDLWRWRTGKVKPEELGWTMVGA